MAGIRKAVSGAALLAVAVGGFGVSASAGSDARSDDGVRLSRGEVVATMKRQRMYHWQSTDVRQPDCAGVQPCVDPVWSGEQDWERLLGVYVRKGWIDELAVEGLAWDMAYGEGDLFDLMQGINKYGFSNNIAPSLCDNIDRRYACQDDKTGIEFDDGKRDGRLKRWLKETGGKLFSRKGIR